MSDETTDPELVTLRDMTVLRLEPGDIVVLRHPKALSAAAQARLVEGWQRILDRMGLRGSVTVVVHEEGMAVGVLRAGEPAEALEA